MGQYRTDGDFSRKLPNFPTSRVFAPLTGFIWNWVSAEGSEKNGIMELPDGPKSFKIDLAI